MPDEAVGVNGVPVKVGLLLSALDDIAEAMAVYSASISVPLITFAGLPVLRLSFVCFGFFRRKSPCPFWRFGKQLE